MVKHQTVSGQFCNRDLASLWACFLVKARPFEYKNENTLHQNNLDFWWMVKQFCNSSGFSGKGLTEARAEVNVLSFFISSKIETGRKCYLSSSWCYKTFFGGILENLDFPRSWNSKNRPFKSKNSFRVLICLKLALFSHFSAGSDIRTNFFHFLILGKSRFPPKKVL